MFSHSCNLLLVYIPIMSIPSTQPVLLSHLGVEIEHHCSYRWTESFLNKVLGIRQFHRQFLNLVCWELYQWEGRFRKPASCSYSVWGIEFFLTRSIWQMKFLLFLLISGTFKPTGHSPQSWSRSQLRGSQLEVFLDGPIQMGLITLLKLASNIVPACSGFHTWLHITSEMQIDSAISKVDHILKWKWERTAKHHHHTHFIVAGSCTLMPNNVWHNVWHSANNNNQVFPS